MSESDNTVEQQEQEIVRVARRILSGEVSIITGAREMSSVRFLSHSDNRDEEFLVFVGIDSETDHLPLGDVRKLWATDALIHKDDQINEAEEFFRERALNAARILIERYEPKCVQPKPTWWRTSLPDSRSVPYFVPVWLVFAYIAAEAALHLPRAQYLGVFFAVAQLVAQVPRGIHGITLRQWFTAAAVLPTVATVLLVQAIKLTMYNP